MRTRKILVSGLGIAGATLAYWLRRYGFETTVVERAPAPREGGYILDFWGVGFEVADRMNLVPALLREGYDMQGIRFVDQDSAPICTISVQSFRAALGERYISILRSGLARILYESLDANVERRFGDTIQAIEQREDGAGVVFANGDKREYDLVLGADGLHSVVRSLAFGPEAQFDRFYGYYAASFTIDYYPNSDRDIYVSFTKPGKQVARYLLRDGRTAVLMVFRQDLRDAHAQHDGEAQRRLLRDVYGGEGWECVQLLKHLDAAPDLYFDAVSQIRMPWWSVGRVALVGDACFCPSLLSGQGSAIAMAGAYVLAGEIKAADGDHVAAFMGYERRLRRFVADKQATAERFAGSFVPRTRFGVWTRNQVSRLMFLPSVARWFGKRFLVDPIELKDYEAA